MAQLSRYRLRFKMNPLNHDAMTCIIQGSQPKIWRGVSCYVEIGIYSDATTFVNDISNITKVVMDIAATNNRSGGSLVQKEILYAAMSAVTQVNWESGGGSYYHARFELSASDTNFDMSSAGTSNQITLWVVFHAVLSGGEVITLGATNLTVEEDAAALGTPVLGTQHVNFRITSGGEFQLLGKTSGKYYPPFVKDDVAGAEQVSVETGES